ncbi:unnamed protein product [Dicrocoelium dendriticum]|nr:unnamed protein product [Dicrocoelium dendriticum]
MNAINFVQQQLRLRHANKCGYMLRASISSKIGVPYDTVGCGFSSILAPPNRTHVIVKIENKGSAGMLNFVMDLFSEWEKRRKDSKIAGFKLQSHFAIRISMGSFENDLTVEKSGIYGTATEVMHIAETTCSRYEKLENTEKIAGYKNFTCLVTGPHRGYLKGVFFMHFESDETDAITITKEALEKRIITGNGYDITSLLITVLNFTF